MPGERSDPYSPVETDEGEIVSMADRLSTDGILLPEFADDSFREGAPWSTDDAVTESVLAASRMIHRTGELATKPILTDAEIVDRYNAMLDRADTLRDQGLDPRLADPGGDIGNAFRALLDRQQKAEKAQEDAQQIRLNRQNAEAMKIERQRRALERIAQSASSQQAIEKATNEYLARERAREEIRLRPYGK